MNRKVTFTNLLTKAQVLHTYAFAGMNKDLIPHKGYTTILNVPEPNKVAIEVKWDTRKGTYEDRLYRCEHVQYLTTTA